MRSRLFVVAVAAFAAAAAVRARAEEPRARSFEIRYEGSVDAPAGATVELWVPLPHKDSSQTVASFQPIAEMPTGMTEANKPETTTVAPNEFLHIRGTGKVVLGWVAKVERRERRSDADKSDETATLPLPDDVRAKFSKELETESINPLGDDLKKIAESIAPGEKKLVSVARAIYEHVLVKMRYDKPAGQAWGRGSVSWACEKGYGNCTDFHALFMALCRLKGIPARFSIGLSLPPKKPEQEISGYHCWAEFWLPGAGWVPVDASEAWKNKEKRAYFFGALDENRIELTTGRDLVLAPPQKGTPLNFMVDPYAEVDGKPVKATRKVVVREAQ